MSIPEHSQERKSRSHLDQQSPARGRNSIQQVLLTGTLFISVFGETNGMSLALLQEKQANQALTVYFTAANLTSVPSASTLSSSDREIVTLQALVCQLDVATERFANACRSSSCTMFSILAWKFNRPDWTSSTTCSTARHRSST